MGGYSASLGGLDSGGRGADGEFSMYTSSLKK